MVSFRNMTYLCPLQYTYKLSVFVIRTVHKISHEMDNEQKKRTSIDKFRGRLNLDYLPVNVSG